MKKTFKKIAAVLAAVSVIGTGSISASAATKEDVIAAARGAGFLEEYVQQLAGFLNTSKFTESQYDVMIGYIYSAGEEMDELALRYTGKTIAELKGLGGSGNSDDSDEDNDSDNDNNNNNDKDKTEDNDKNSAQSWVEDQLRDMVTEEEVLGILDHLVEGGKELGLDITVESKGDKNFTMTVKDKDGNVQFVAPIGKLIDRTGVEEAENSGMLIAMGSSVVLTAVGIAGAVTIARKTRKNEE